MGQAEGKKYFVKAESQQWYIRRSVYDEIQWGGLNFEMQ